MRTHMHRSVAVSLLILLTSACGKSGKDSPRPAPETPPVTPDMAQSTPERGMVPGAPSIKPALIPTPKKPAATPPKPGKLPKGTLLAKVTRRKRRTMVRNFTSSFSVDALISVKMAPDKSLTLIDKGKWVDRVANMRKSICQTEREERTWETTYKGTWLEKGEQLLFSVKRTAESCTHIKKCDNRPPENKKCPKTAKSFTITCTKESVTIRDIAKPSPAWSCSPGEAKTHTYGPWKFGLNHCIERYSGTRGPYSYNLCKP